MPSVHPTAEILVDADFLAHDAEGVDVVGYLDNDELVIFDLDSLSACLPSSPPCWDLEPPLQLMYSAPP